MKLIKKLWVKLQDAIVKPYDTPRYLGRKNDTPILLTKEMEVKPKVAKKQKLQAKIKKATTKK